MVSIQLSPEVKRKALIKAGYNPDQFDFDENFRPVQIQRSEITSVRDSVNKPVGVEPVRKDQETSFIGETIGSIRNPIEAIDRRIQPQKYADKPSMSQNVKEDLRQDGRGGNFLADKIDQTQQRKSDRKAQFAQAIYQAHNNPVQKKAIINEMIAAKEEMTQKYPDYLKRAETAGQNSDWFKMKLIDLDPELAFEKYHREFLQEKSRKNTRSKFEEFKDKELQEVFQDGQLKSIGKGAAAATENFFDALTNKVLKYTLTDVPGTDKSIAEDILEKTRYLTDPANKIKETLGLKEADPDRYQYLADFKDKVKTETKKAIFYDPETAYGQGGEVTGQMGADILEFYAFYAPAKSAVLSSVTANANKAKAAGNLAKYDQLMKRSNNIKQGVSYVDEFVADLAASLPIALMDTADRNGDEEDFVKLYSQSAALGLASIAGEKYLRRIFQGLKGVDFKALDPTEATQTIVKEMAQALRDMPKKQGGYVDFQAMADDIGGRTSNNEFSLLPTDVDLDSEYNKTGAKRIAPDRIVHQQTDPNIAIQKIIDQKKGLYDRVIEMQKKYQRPVHASKGVIESFEKIKKKVEDGTARETERRWLEKNQELIEFAREYKEIAEIFGDKKLFKQRDYLEKLKNLRDNISIEDVRKDYITKVKKDISRGYRYPESVLGFDKSFTRAVNARERYEKGLRTSFSVDDDRIVFEATDIIGAGMKRQDGKAINQSQKTEIIEGVKDFSQALNLDMKKIGTEERWVYVHLSGKNPFLRKNAAGLYRKSKDNISISVGGTESIKYKDPKTGEMVTKKINTTLAHELGHALDYKLDKKLIPKSDINKWKSMFNRPDISSRSYSNYLKQDVEVVARSIEQYVAVKNGLKSFYNKPGYWRKDFFEKNIAPKIQEAMDKHFTNYRLPDGKKVEYNKQSTKEKVKPKSDYGAESRADEPSLLGDQGNSAKAGQDPLERQSGKRSSPKELKSDHQSHLKQNKQQTYKKSSQNNIPIRQPRDQKKFLDFYSSDKKVARQVQQSKLNVEFSDERFELPKPKLLDNMRRYVEDFNFPIKRLQREIQSITKEDIPDYLDLYAKKDMLPRVQSRRIEKLEKRRTKFVQGLIEDDLRVADLDDYLRARHAPERNKRMKELALEEGREAKDGLSGMTDDEAAQIIKKVEASGKIDVYQKHEAKLRKIMNDTLDFQVKEGLMSAEDARTIRSTYEHYVPLQRDLGEEAEYTLGIGRGVDIRGKEIKKAKGSTKEVITPTAQIFQAAQKAQVRALKNDIAKTVVNLTKEYPALKSIFEVESQQYRPKYDKNGELQYLEPNQKFGFDREKVIGAKIEGKQYYIKINNPLIARAITNQSLVSVHPFLNISKKLTGFWSAMATRYNPEFMITNFQRDLTDAVINAKASGVKNTKGMTRSILKNVPKAQREIWTYLRKDKGSKELEEFFDLGGDTGHFWLQDVKTSAKSLEKLEKRLRNEGFEKIMNPVRAAGNFIDDVNSVIELGTRYSFYKESVRRGLSKPKAIQAAADLTVNFSRQGEVTPGLKALWAFINPAIQGSSRTIRALTTSKKAQQAAAGLAMLGFVNGYLQDQLESNDAVPDWMKNRQLVFEFPEWFPGFGGQQVSLWNLSYGYAPFFAIGRNGYDMINGKTEKEKALKNVLETTATAFLPFQGSFNDFIPTPFRPISEIRTNKNFMDSEIYPEWNKIKSTPTPNYLESKKYTSEAAKFIAETVFKVTGGRVDWYPDSLDHVFKSYTAGTGKFITNTVDTLIKAADPEKRKDIDTHQVSFVRKFFADAESKKRSKVFSDIYDTMEISAKRKLSERKIEKFFEALDIAQQQEYLRDDQVEKNTRDFIKAQFDVPSVSKIKKSKIQDPSKLDVDERATIEEIKKALDAMPEKYYGKLLGAFAENTANKYRMIKEGDISKNKKLTKEDIDKVVNDPSFKKLSRDQRISVLKSLKERSE